MAMNMWLNEIVETSRRVLTGVPRQGRIGIGFARLRAARAVPTVASRNVGWGRRGWPKPATPDVKPQPRSENVALLLVSSHSGSVPL